MAVDDRLLSEPLADGSGLIDMQRRSHAQDLWRIVLATQETRRLTVVAEQAMMMSFDATPEGERIVFDRLTEDSDILLIESRQAR